MTQVLAQIDFDDLRDALNHFNRAADRMQSNFCTAIDTASDLFDCLNKVQTGWLLSSSGREWLNAQPATPDRRPGEVKTFQQMVLSKLNRADRSDLLSSRELEVMLAFDPLIANDQIVNDHRTPQGSISSNTLKKATEVHCKLRSSFKNYHDGDTPELQERLTKRTAELLYIVRSNIKHGQKVTRKRDISVAEVVVPVQRLLIDLLLKKPSHRLLTLRDACARRSQSRCDRRPIRMLARL